MKVGLFDSGIGGLTVLKTLKRKYPHNDYIYYGDTLNVPYGNKSKEELLKLAKHNIEFLINKKVDLIIIACGTVSSNCLNELKKLHNIKIMSIIEPTIKYLNTLKDKNIGVIATTATINSHIFKNSLCHNVYEITTPNLVPLIEENKDTNKVLHEYLDEYKNKLDMLVLGCTHYPIVMNNIKSILKNTEVLDMSNYIEINDEGNSNIDIYFSRIDNTIISNTRKILAKNDIDIKLDT